MIFCKLKLTYCFFYNQVKSSDADSGSNAEIEYYVSDDHFTVNSNGVISNNKKLDADSNNAYYEFIVTAKGNLNFLFSPTIKVKFENFKLPNGYIL